MAASAQYVDVETYTCETTFEQLMNEQKVYDYDTHEGNWSAIDVIETPVPYTEFKVILYATPYEYVIKVDKVTNKITWIYFDNHEEDEEEEDYFYVVLDCKK